MKAKCKILFVCLGNICRSPMAEYLLKDKLQKAKLDHLVYVDSAGTADYHNGEFMHQQTSAILSNKNIYHLDFISSQIQPSDLDKYDLILGMDDDNISDLTQILDVSDKIHNITNLSAVKATYIPDPWYTGDFNQTYKLLNQCCDDIIQLIKDRYLL